MTSSMHVLVYFLCELVHTVNIIKSLTDTEYLLLKKILLLLNHVEIPYTSSINIEDVSSFPQQAVAQSVVLRAATLAAEVRVRVNPGIFFGLLAGP